jgi:hypothetical protein
MKITKIAANVNDYDRLYNHLKSALEALDRGSTGVTRRELKAAIRRLEMMEPVVKREKLKTLWDLRRIR